jgi:hypothetical protein
VRLLHLASVVACGVDSVRAFQRRLISLFTGALACALVLCFSPVLLAQGVGVNLYNTSSQSQAYSYCEDNIPYYSASVTVLSCTPVVASNGLNAYAFEYTASPQDVEDVYTYPGSPVNPCSALATTVSDWTFKAGQSLPSTANVPETDSATGATVQCGYSVTYAQPTAVADQYGWFHVQQTMTPTGNPSGGGATSPSGTTFNNVSGDAVTTANGTTPSPTNPDPLVTECGPGSCYNESSGNFSVIDGASSGSADVSIAAAESGGGCGSAGGSTICAGAPSAPSPVGTAGTEITSPSTEQTAQTTYQTANASTGALGTVQVAVYTAPGTTTSSGSSSSSGTAGTVGALTNGGSSSPASSSSSGNADSDSPSGNCNTPPQCSGDSVMCGIQIQDWDAMCVQQNYMVGNGQQPPTFASDQTAYTQSQVWVQPPSNLDNTEGGQANQGTYNESGFGYATSCPMQDFTFTSVAVTIPFASKGCQPLSYFRYIAIGLALFAAAKITAGGTG